MASGLLKQFESIRPGETVQGLIDPTWPGLVKGSGTMNPNAAWPLVGMAAARSLPAAASFVRQGTGEIVDTLKGVGNVARKFPYHIAKNLIQGEETARQLKKVTEQIKGREYPHDVRVEEDDAGEFLGPGVFGEDDVDIPEDEELLDKQLRAQGFDPDAIVERAEEKIKVPDNVISLESRRKGLTEEEEKKLYRDAAINYNVIRQKLEAGEKLDERDQVQVNHALFDQKVVDEELEIEGDPVDVFMELNPTMHGMFSSSLEDRVDDLFNGLNFLDHEELEQAQRDLEKILVHVSTARKSNVVPFPMDAEDAEPEDEVVFGESELLSFPQSRTIGKYEVRTELQKDKTYKVYVTNNNTEETKEVPYLPEVVDVLFGDMSQVDMDKLVEVLAMMFQED